MNKALGAFAVGALIGMAIGPALAGAYKRLVPECRRAKKGANA